MSERFNEQVPLSGVTTIGLGGPARLFAECTSTDHLIELLTYAEQENLPFIILGGGSNIVFPDAGFEGLVIRIAMKGITIRKSGGNADLSAAAGEDWDPLVLRTVREKLAGFECLSGIPGLVGATPIQNVGAYGQEVSETIVSVEALDTRTKNVVEFSNEECEFGYRMSRFKGRDRGTYIITSVTFRLTDGGGPSLRYEELISVLKERPDPDLGTVRNAVLSLRRRKSMLIDPLDPNSRSVGSFFTNPVIPKDEYERMADRWKRDGNEGTIPFFSDGERVKVPAAWLVEHAGFSRGMRRGRVGLSTHHALALVNLGGSTTELLAFADEIKRSVHTRFSILLEPEPTIVG
ncbi:MAG: UDP-N-acetylmuramate dehydrogenase [Ignavibacteria bacterium]|nr:UDP-N-acetylmuramate dehydrogenase [Ignavibacteria bacterium]